MSKPFSYKAQADISTPEDLVELGHITGAFGVRGMVKIKPYAADSVLPKVDKWWLRPRRMSAARSAQVAASPVPHRLMQVEHCRWHSDSLIASFVGVADRDIAEDLKGMVISVSRADFPQEDADEFYWVDLIGCWVYTVDAQVTAEGGQSESSPVLLGQVKELSDNGVHAILHVDRYVDGVAGGEAQPLLTAKGRHQQSMVPFVEAHVLVVDLENQYIKVDWPLDF